MKNKPKILVIGSANMDMVIKTDNFPVPGETIIGGQFSLIPGGKGANQAVAAARLGGEVSFLAQLGDDVFGAQNLENYQKEGINTSLIKLNPGKPSGVALITVDHTGENTIIVAPGANASLSVDDIHAARNFFEVANVILIQLEIQLPVVFEACKLAFSLGKKIILNPAPATDLQPEIFPFLFMITPNETETERLTGVKVFDEKTAEDASEILMAKGVQNVIITMGSAGAYVHTGEFKGVIPTKKVKALDTTAAGDTFNGALVVALVNGDGIKEAVDFALKAATMSVTKMGAQSSIPYWKDL
ncbi:ribokinase [Aquiflexum sp.]|uniref:ribokinase n=1 Tax=Aquiflexum sp. TaxID=1872584 RepID=UPI0035934452